LDPNALLLPDGHIRVVTMNPHGPPAPPLARIGTISTFTSTDHGRTWIKDPDYRLQYDSFTEWNVYSLKDPKLILLPDGRYRIYLASMIKNKVIDKIILHLKLTFQAKRPHPPQIVQQELLTTAEERGKYF